MEEALRNGLDIPSERLDVYALDLHSRYWPVLVHEHKLVHSNPNTVAMRESAAALQGRILNIAPKLKVLGGIIVSKMRRLGNIAEMPDNESPLGTKYHFKNMASAECWITYNVLSIVLNRILHDLAIILDEPVVLLDSENAKLSRDICMCAAYIGTLGTLPGALFQPAWFMAYEGTNGLERAYLRNFIMQSDKFKRRLPQDGAGIENFALKTAYALAGRGEFYQPRQVL